MNSFITYYDKYYYDMETNELSSKLSFEAPDSLKRRISNVAGKKMSSNSQVIREILDSHLPDLVE